MDRDSLWVSVPVTVDMSWGSSTELGWCNGGLSLLEWVAMDNLGLGVCLPNINWLSVTSRSCCAEVPMSGAGVCEVHFSYMVSALGMGQRQKKKKTKNFWERTPVRESQNSLHYVLPLHRCSRVRLHQGNCCDFSGMPYKCSKYPKSNPAISHPDTLGRVHTLRLHEQG